MDALQSLLAQLEGLSSEEVADMIRASKHAGMVPDADAFAAALVAASEAA